MEDIETLSEPVPSDVKMYCASLLEELRLLVGTVPGYDAINKIRILKGGLDALAEIERTGKLLIVDFTAVETLIFNITDEYQQMDRNTVALRTFLDEVREKYHLPQNIFF